MQMLFLYSWFDLDECAVSYMMRSFIIVIKSSSERPQTLTLKTMLNIELLHELGLHLMACPSLPLSLADFDSAGQRRLLSQTQATTQTGTSH